MVNGEQIVPVNNAWLHYNGTSVWYHKTTDQYLVRYQSPDVRVLLGYLNGSINMKIRIPEDLNKGESNRIFKGKDVVCAMQD